MAHSVNPPNRMVPTDPTIPLTNLATLRTRLDSLTQYLTDSVNSNTILTTHQLDSVNAELTSAIHQVVINGASLLATQVQSQHDPNPIRIPTTTTNNNNDGVGGEIVELDEVEILAENVHVCDFCGKGFKRDANLRMHMRAHGDRFKSKQALSKTGESAVDINVKTRFSCPYVGCNRNKRSTHFRPLKSIACVKTHFKRSHCINKSTPGSSSRVSS